MYQETIGIVGGMGSWATVDFFRRLVAAFPAEKEWDRPRILIDNNCTMPSRVRSILYNENTDELKAALAQSVKNLNVMANGDIRIVLACNTSHYFMPYLKDLFPDLRNSFVDIIGCCVNKIKSKKSRGEVIVIASEGTILSKIYDTYFEDTKIEIKYPDDLSQIRSYIEMVKQNNISSVGVASFREYLMNFPMGSTIILGCTELPVIYSKIMYDTGLKDLCIVDPLEETIKYLKLHLR